MLKGTAGNLLVNDALPEGLRRADLLLDKKGAASLLTELAQKHPEQYRDVLKKLMDMSLQTAYWSGGYSFGLKHLQSANSARQLKRELEDYTHKVWADARLPEKEKERLVLSKSQEYQQKIEKAVFDESLAEHNPLAYQVLSGSRGNKMNLSTLRGSDTLYTDHHGNPIPVPVLRSYSEGLRPHEYFAGTFGARTGLIGTKLSVADTGFAAKMMVQMGHRLLVTAHDADEAHDAATPRGLPVATDDPHNEGAVLAHEAGGYKRNTVLTPKILQHLKEKGADKILARSPLVGGPPDGGVYSLDAGVREKGRLAPPGDFIGVSAAQALAEVLTQATLGSKHHGGVAGASKQATGFQAVDQLLQVPKVFQGGAAHSQLDGKVQSVEPAPQGGNYVTVSGQRHYVPRGFDPLVKAGDDVEAGDVLSDGTPNPAEVVTHKGIGEGRRYFVEAMHDAYKRSGMPAHRRNIELIARGLINHVRLNEEYGDHVPDDTMAYSRLEHLWEPRDGHKVLDPRQARGMYLEKPVLHYSIGTRIRPSVIKNLQEFGVKEVTAHHQPPPFEPEMIRGLESTANDADWMTRFIGSYVKKNFLKGVHRGDSSDERGTSYVPSLARAVDFNHFPPVKGYEPTGPVNMAPPGRATSLLDGLR